MEIRTNRKRPREDGLDAKVEEDENDFMNQMGSQIQNLSSDYISVDSGDEGEDDDDSEKKENYDDLFMGSIDDFENVLRMTPDQDMGESQVLETLEIQ